MGPFERANLNHRGKQFHEHLSIISKDVSRDTSLVLVSDYDEGITIFISIIRANGDGISTV
jgi:hypothetical protein